MNSRCFTVDEYDNPVDIDSYDHLRSIISLIKGVMSSNFSSIKTGKNPYFFLKKVTNILKVSPRGAMINLQNVGYFIEVKECLKAPFKRVLKQFKPITPGHRLATKIVRCVKARCFNINILSPKHYGSVLSLLNSRIKEIQEKRFQAYVDKVSVPLTSILKNRLSVFNREELESKLTVNNPLYYSLSKLYNDNLLPLEDRINYAANLVANKPKNYVEANLLCFFVPHNRKKGSFIINVPKKPTSVYTWETSVLMEVSKRKFINIEDLFYFTPRSELKIGSLNQYPVLSPWFYKGPYRKDVAEYQLHENMGDAERKFFHESYCFGRYSYLFDRFNKVLWPSTRWLRSGTTRPNPKWNKKFYEAFGGDDSNLPTFDNDSRIVKRRNGELIHYNEWKYAQEYYYRRRYVEPMVESKYTINKLFISSIIMRI